MKKKVLICVRSFGQGGIPRCLQTLLEYIDTSRYSVDVLCLTNEGAYAGEIHNCRIIDAGAFVRQLCVFSSHITRWNFYQFLPTLLCKSLRALCKMMFHTDLLEVALSRKARKLSNQYDAAISYEEGDVARVVAEMRCGNKMIWIHNDYKWVASAGVGTPFEKFDKICCVSEASRQSFVKVYPHLEERTLTIHNLVNENLIAHQAQEPIDDARFADNCEPFIVSVGRICYQKNFEAIPAIVKKLKEMGDGLKWYIIGKGPDEKRLDEIIAENGVGDCVVRLGEKSNPYPYMAKAAFYALTSRYESYPTVVNEALALGTYVLSTPIPAAAEMLGECGGGEMASLDLWPEKIAALAGKQPQRIPYDFGKHNEMILQQFYQLINNN